MTGDRPLAVRTTAATTGAGTRALELFSTCPQSKGQDPEHYAARVADVARWSEAGGCQGILVYTDNGLVDPWLLSQLILQATEELCPLVAVQPAYMHPFAAAKMVTSLAHLHGRRVFLNMVAGGFRNDLLALDDPTPHDERYERLVEYTQIVRALLSQTTPVTFEGRYYTVKKLRINPPMPPALFPGITVSGSSDAGLAAARAIGATAVKYPKPPSEENDHSETNDAGLRVGVIARDDHDDAWQVAYRRFPPSRQGQITHDLAMKISDSSWHRQLSELGKQRASEDNPYWLGPFENYKTFCPYLVGTYERVGQELRGYVDRGFRTFILDVPVSGDEFTHIGRAFSYATS